MDCKIERRVLKRLQEELNYLNENPSEDYQTGPISDSDCLHWQAVTKGPDNSPYKDWYFFLKIDYPKDYPFHPPKCTFETRIYHPNINSGGFISLDILTDQWSPSFTINKLLLYISSLLTNPSPDHVVDCNIFQVYQKDRDRYERNEREWTKKFAC